MAIQGLGTKNENNNICRVFGKCDCMTSETTSLLAGKVQVDNTPLLLSAKDTAVCLGISRSYLYEMSSSGILGPLPVKFGRRSLWIRDELTNWVAAGCPVRHKWVEIKKLEKHNSS